MRATDWERSATESSKRNLHITTSGVNVISIDASDDTHFPYSCTIFRAWLGHCYGSHVGFERVLEDVCIYGAFCQMLST